MNEDRHTRARVLRRKQVQELTGLSRSTICLRIAQGTFPTAISLGARLESEIDEWLESRVELSRS